MSLSGFPSFEQKKEKSAELDLRHLFPGIGVGAGGGGNREVGYHLRYKQMEIINKKGKKRHLNSIRVPEEFPNTTAYYKVQC